MHYIKDSAYFYVLIYTWSTKEQILFYFDSENHMNEKPNMSDMAKTHVAY